MATIQHRKQIEVNTDPQGRCYYGVHAKSEMRWTPWRELCNATPENVEERLKFWRDLNDYEVSQRGQEARCEYRAV